MRQRSCLDRRSMRRRQLEQPRDLRPQLLRTASLRDDTCRTMPLRSTSASVGVVLAPHTAEVFLVHHRRSVDQVRVVRLPHLLDVAQSLLPASRPRRPPRSRTSAWARRTPAPWERIGLQIATRSGFSALQSGHQCAQKNTSAGWPFGSATPASAGAGLPSRLSRLIIFWMRVRIGVHKYFCRSPVRYATASARWLRAASHVGPPLRSPRPAPEPAAHSDRSLTGCFFHSADGKRVGILGPLLRLRRDSCAPIRREPSSSWLPAFRRGARALAIGLDHRGRRAGEIVARESRLGRRRTIPAAPPPACHAEHGRRQPAPPPRPPGIVSANLIDSRFSGTARNVLTQIITLQRELHRGFQESELVAGVVARCLRTGIRKSDGCAAGASDRRSTGFRRRCPAPPHRATGKSPASAHSGR